MSATAKGHDVRQVGARVVLALLILASGLAVVVTQPEPAEAAIRDPFDPVFSTDDNGATLLTGNSQMTCPPAASGCTAALTSPPATTTSVNGFDNDAFAMQFLDTDGSPETTNSTSADVNLPDGSMVLYARLLWGGRRTAGTGGVAAGAGISQVKVRAPGQATYTTVTATTTIAPNLSGSDAMPYQASLDVTSLVRSAGNGTYWVGDIQAATGLDRYAGWSLIVTYRNPALPLRRLMIFEGFADVATTSGNSIVSIPISGFLTPAAGPVNVSVGFVAWDGDRGIRGEEARLRGVQLANEARPPTNFFDSSITDAGANITERSPNTPNTFGVDVARTTANGVLPNAATSATVTMSTVQDGFYPGIVTGPHRSRQPGLQPDQQVGRQPLRQRSRPGGGHAGVPGPVREHGPGLRGQPRRARCAAGQRHLRP